MPSNPAQQTTPAEWLSWLKQVRGNPEAIASWIDRLREDWAGATKAERTALADQGRILQQLYVEATGAEYPR